MATLSSSDDRIIMKTADGKTVNVNANDTEKISALQSKGFSTASTYKNPSASTSSSKSSNSESSSKSSSKSSSAAAEPSESKVAQDNSKSEFTTYVDPKTGSTISTRGEAPEGYALYDPATMTKDGVPTLSKVRESVGYDATKYAGGNIPSYSTTSPSLESVFPSGEAALSATGPTLSSLTKNVVSETPVSTYDPNQKSEAQTVREQIAEETKNQNIARFKAAFEQAKGVAKQSEEALAQEERTQTGQIRTADVMARAAAEKAGAPMGLSAAGSALQSDIAQNVLTQGAESQLRQNVMNQKSAIQQQLAEAENEMNLGIADAETTANIEKLNAQLAEIERVESEMIPNYIATIGRFTQDFQAEIDRITNDGDPTNDWQIPYLQAARQEKIAAQNLDPITGAQLPTEVSYTVPQAIDAFRAIGYATPEIASALGIDPGTGYMAYASSGGGTTSGTTTPTTTIATDAEFYTNRQDMIDRLSRRGVDADGAIRLINQYSEFYVDEYGEDVVNSVVNDLINSLQPEQVTAAELSGSEALKLWQQIGTANQSIANALGVAVGQEYVGGTVADDFSFTEAISVLDKMTTLEQRARQLDAWAADGVPTDVLDQIAELYSLPGSTSAINQTRENYFDWLEQQNNPFGLNFIGN